MSVDDVHIGISGDGPSRWRAADVASKHRRQVALPVRAPVDDSYQVMPVFDRQIAPLAAVGTRLSVGGVPAGVQEQGGAGAQGTSSVPGYLDVGQRPTSRSVPAGDTTITADYTGGARPARLDGVLLQPDIEWVTLGGPGRGQALLRSFAGQLRHHVIHLGGGRVTAYSYDATGRLVTTTKGAQGSVDAPVVAGGFTTVATN